MCRIYLLIEIDWNCRDKKKWYENASIHFPICLICSPLQLSKKSCQHSICHNIETTMIHSTKNSNSEKFSCSTPITTCLVTFILHLVSYASIMSCYEGRYRCVSTFLFFNLSSHHITCSLFSVYTHIHVRRGCQRIYS